MRRTYTSNTRDTYEVSGNELRIYWDEKVETHEDFEGNIYNGYSYLEAVLPANATKFQIVHVVRKIDNTIDAESLADNWFETDLYKELPQKTITGANTMLGTNGRTLIVPDSHVELARNIAAAFGTGGENMFIAPLSPTGDKPATHWCSTGYVPAEFSDMVPLQVWSVDEEGNWVAGEGEDGNPQMVFDIVTQDVVDEEGNVIKPGLSVTLQDIQELFEASDVTQQEPRTAFSRLGLEQVRAELEDTP